MKARMFVPVALAVALLVPDDASTLGAQDSAFGPGGPVGEFRQRVRSLFEAEEFGRLEKIAEESRAGRLRCSDGYWQLAHFYDVLHHRDDRLSRDLWLEVIDKARRWAETRPRSVTAQIVLAGAWTGFAMYSDPRDAARDPIGPEEQELLLDRLNKARTILDGAQKLGVSDPHLFHILQRVARTEGWDRSRYEDLFRTAIQLEPTYYSYYYEKALYLTPDWHGRPGQLAEFATEAADATHAQEGDVVYALIAATAFFARMDEDRQNVQFFERTGLSWARARRGFEDFAKRYPDSPGNLDCFARLACVARDKEATRKAMDGTGGHFRPRYWPSEGQFRQCYDWSHDDGVSRRTWLESLLSVFRGE